MSFYRTANVLIESSASEEVSDRELVQTYVMSLFDFEKEAAIIYDFLEEEGFLDMGVYMAKTDKVNNDAYGDSHYYIMFPRSVVVGTNVLRRFFKLYEELARNNKFHFLIKQGDSMLIDGKNLVGDAYKVRKWKPMKKKTREHFGDILDGLRESKEEKWAYLLKVKARMKEEIKLKPKTQKHFGKILSGLNEEITTDDIESSARAREKLKGGGRPDHVVIFLTYNRALNKQNEYIFKPIKNLNRQEIDIYKTMIKYKIDSTYTDEFGLSVFMATSDEVSFVGGLDYISMYKGDKKDLEVFLHSYLKINDGENYIEKKPIMGKKAEKHFGDIIDSL